MATTTTGAAAATPPAGKSKLVIILIAALLIVSIAGGAGFYFLYKRGNHPAAPAPIPAPVFYPLEPFTVNLLSDADDGRYLHLGLTLRLPNEKAKEMLIEHLPELRSRILLLLTSKRPADLATLDGKQHLAAEIRSVAEKPFNAEDRGRKVNEILFTEFVVQ